MGPRCDACRGGCEGSCTADYPDTPPGAVQRMNKTKVERGVWAAARALVFDEQFPKLLDSTQNKHSAFDSTSATTALTPGTGSAASRIPNFKYDWKRWLSNLFACLDRGGAALPPSCERMVRVLHFIYAKDYVHMLALAPQIARAVIELEYRRSEKDRIADGIGPRPIATPGTTAGAGAAGEVNDPNETKLMTVVRSACGHKHKQVVQFVHRVIQHWFPRIELDAATASANSTDPSSATGVIASPSSTIITMSETDPVGAAAATATATAAAAAAEPFNALLTTSAFGEFNWGTPAPIPLAGAESLYQFSLEGVLDNVSTMHNTHPAAPVVTAANEREVHETVSARELVSTPLYTTGTGAGGLLATSMNGTGAAGATMNDPLAHVMVQCQLGDTTSAVRQFKQTLGCSDQTAMAEQARASGVTPWHYMWLRLGDLVLERQRTFERTARSPVPDTKKLLAELDVVFAEIEPEREYGEFTHDARVHLQRDMERGNFAALATWGLLLLGADADLGGGAAVVQVRGQYTDAQREAEGLRLVLKAMETDPWMTPLLLVRLVQNKHVPLLPETVHGVLTNLQARAKSCSIAALHYGDLLANEMAHSVGYECNVHGAANAFRDCLYGVDIPREIRLLCMQRAGRLAAFGISGIGVDLSEADRVLSKGVEAGDTFCIAHLANVRLRQSRPEDAADLFQMLFQRDEREVYISAQIDNGAQPAPWETYRIHVLEQEEQHFLTNVRTGACLPIVMKRERASEYGELMVIELHDRGLSAA